MKNTDLFELLRAETAAEDAARFYGLEFGKNKRARCPWHDDHHPDLRFYPDGSCFCFACGAGGDAVALTAQVLGLSMIDAAKQLAHDFGIAEINDRPDPAMIEKRKQQRQRERDRREAAKRDFNRRWGRLCDIVREADQELRRFTDPETAWENPRFVAVLTARTRANEQLDLMWEGQMDNERRA